MTAMQLRERALHLSEAMRLLHQAEAILKSLESKHRDAMAQMNRAA